MKTTPTHYLRLLLPALLLLVLAAACHDDDISNNYKKYASWREANDAFYQEQKELLDPETGSLYYSSLVPVWNSGGEILIRYLNDRTLTEGNLSPLATSVVNVKYKGWLMDGTPFDSSYTATDSVFTTKVTSVIEGWQTALQYMRVGDSVRVVIPAAQAYASAGSGAVLPFSVLTFDVKLKDIRYYEIKP
ncbi:MAG: FKBP-type peptidyl-prolyl cis-trans isomerase [Duncaniella sp.]|nr:FKBP-type peptidyl-prolyl cis-trans isomerase [Duncaniella sp.]